MKLRRRSGNLAIHAGVVALLTGLTVHAELFRDGPALADDAAPFVRLAYQFQPNQSLHFEFTQELSMRSRKQEFKNSVSSQTTLRKHLRVISVNEQEQALIEPVIDSAKMSSSEDGGPATEFDSADREQQCPAMFRSLQSVVGKPQVRVLFSSRGEVIKATGVNGGESAAQGLESDATLNFLIVLPTDAVRVNETWQDEFEVVLQLSNMLKKPVTLRREYRLVKLMDRLAEIEMRTEVITPVNDPALELQLLPRLVAGTIVFDHQAGRIVSREQSVDRQVINALGQGSLVHFVTRQAEKAVENPKIARRERK